MNMGYSNNVQKLLQEDLAPKAKYANPVRNPEVVVPAGAPRENKETPLKLTMFKYVRKLKALLTNKNPKFNQLMADRTANENVNKQLAQNQVADEKVAMGLMKQGWEERFNVQENKSYWFNNITQEQSDERPELRIVEQPAEAQMSEMALAEGWEEFYSEQEKRPYWFNKELNSSVWVKPVQQVQASEAETLSQFADQELADTYATLAPKLKNKVDSIADQNGKEIYMRKIIDMRKSLNMLKMTEQAPPAPAAPPPTQALPTAGPTVESGEQVVSVANVLEVPKEKELGAEGTEEQGSEGKEDSGSSSPGEKKVIKIGA
jgi:hypothetical protein